MTSSQFIPTDTGHGTVVGSTYLKTFVLCPRQWFNLYYRPLLGDSGTDSGTVDARGLQPRTRAVPLLTGGIFHEGLAALYLSGCRDGVDTGEWSIDSSIASAEAAWRNAREEFDSDEEANDTLSSTTKMLREYYDRFGPGSRSQDWPEIQVAIDLGGKPIVEREFRLQLSDRYIFTCRSDLLIYHRGYLKTLEHKTTRANYVRTLIGSAGHNPQFTGEIACMKAHLPTLVGEGTPLHGVLLNVILKDRGVKSSFDVAERETTTRTDAQLERWRLQTLNTLQRIDDAVGSFDNCLAAGVDIEVAADQCFPTTGTQTDTCKAYNRPCDYYELCQLPGMESRLMGKYRPRTVEENTTLRERPY